MAHKVPLSKAGELCLLSGNNTHYYFADAVAAGRRIPLLAVLVSLHR